MCPHLLVRHLLAPGPPVDTFLNEHLGELHYGGKTTMSGVPLTRWRALPVVFDHETTAQTPTLLNVGWVHLCVVQNG